MNIIATAALLFLLAALYLALMLAAEKERKASTHARGAAHCRISADGNGDADAGGTRRTRHLSPHRAAIDRMRGKGAR